MSKIISCLKELFFSEVAANKHNSLPNKNLLVLGKLKFRMYECKLNNFKFAQSLEVPELM